MDQAQPKQVLIYEDATGKQPFNEWLYRLHDPKTRRRILQRLSRLESGNYGDYKVLKEGVFELRLDFGSGYRIYCGERGNQFVILLCGGDKSTQVKDIEMAKTYWREYMSHA